MRVAGSLLLALKYPTVSTLRCNNGTKTIFVFAEQQPTRREVTALARYEKAAYDHWHGTTSHTGGGADGPRLYAQLPVCHTTGECRRMATSVVTGRVVK